MPGKENRLIGKRVLRVWLVSDKKAMRFDVEGGDPVIARADGGCCSSTWIEALDMPAFLLGTIRAVEDIEMPDAVPKVEDREMEVIAYYGCKITTDKGSCVIDYRNESNGYYGGNLAWDDEHFYGGVYGQNMSNNDWREVVGETSDAR